MYIVRRYWRIIFPIFFMLIIWIFSSRTGEISEAQSDKVAGFLGMSNEFVRKLAHFVLFGGLGYSCTSFIKGLYPKSFPMHTQVFYPVIVATIYGAFDEVHQLTVAGRSGSAIDVLIDALAGIAGVLAYIAIYCLIKLWRAKKAEKSIDLAEPQEPIHE